MKTPSSRASKESAGELPEQALNAISEIYDRHIGMVYRVCFSLMGNRADAEDAVSAVFLKLFGLFGRGEPVGHKNVFSDFEHEKAWLIVAAGNHCRDVHRQWWRRKVVGVDASTAFSDSPPHSDVIESLMRIPQKYRVALYLFYYEGYKIAEIAGILKLNVNTVKTRLKTAKKLLKLELEN